MWDKYLKGWINSDTHIEPVTDISEMHLELAKISHPAP